MGRKPTGKRLTPRIERASTPGIKFSRFPKWPQQPLPLNKTTGAVNVGRTLRIMKHLYYRHDQPPGEQKHAGNKKQLFLRDRPSKPKNTLKKGKRN